MTLLPLRAATWNVQSCRRGLSGVAAFLRELDADLVGLQEVDRGTLRSGREDQAARLAGAAGLPHQRFFRAVDWDLGEYGLALLSRWPLLDARVGVLPNDGGLEPRILASAVIERPGAPLLVHLTHLTNTNSSLRLAQAECIAERLAAPALPQLLLGDFNALPGTAPHRRLCRGLKDVFARVGEGAGGTFQLPAFLPAVRIDYLFASADLGLASARVARTEASDHHALVARLGVPARAALSRRLG